MDPYLGGAGDVDEPESSFVAGPPFGPFQFGEGLFVGLVGGDDFEDSLSEPAKLAWPEHLGLADEVFLPGLAMLGREFLGRVGDHCGLLDVHRTRGQRGGGRRVRLDIHRLGQLHQPGRGAAGDPVAVAQPGHRAGRAQFGGDPERVDLPDQGELHRGDPLDHHIQIIHTGHDLVGRQPEHRRRRALVERLTHHGQGFPHIDNLDRGYDNFRTHVRSSRENRIGHRRYGRVGGRSTVGGRRWSVRRPYSGSRWWRSASS